MQQAIYNSIDSTINSIRNSGRTANTAKDKSGLVRWIARKWDIVAVVALMGASAAYEVFALAHTGL